MDHSGLGDFFSRGVGHGLVFLDELVYFGAGLVLGQGVAPLVDGGWQGLGWRAAPIGRRLWKAALHYFSNISLNFPPLCSPRIRKCQEEKRFRIPLGEFDNFRG